MPTAADFSMSVAFVTRWNSLHYIRARILTGNFVVCTLAVGKKKKKIRAGFDMSNRTIPLLVSEQKCRLIGMWVRLQIETEEDSFFYKKNVIRMKQSKMTEPITIVTCAREMLGSNPGRDTGCPKWRYFQFSLSLQAHTWIVFSNRS
jgi:hypothetical protein